MKVIRNILLTFSLMLIWFPISVSAQTEGYYKGIMWILLNNPGRGDEAIQKTFNYSISKQEAKAIMAGVVQHYIRKGEEIQQKEEWLDKGVKVSTAIANSKLIKANDIALAILAPGLGISGIASAKTDLQALRALASSQAALASLVFKAASWMEQVGAWKKGKEPDPNVLMTLDKFSNNAGRIGTGVGFTKPTNVSELIQTTQGILSDPAVQKVLKGEKIGSERTINLAGGWVAQGPPPAEPGKSCKIIQEGNNLTLINERGRVFANIFVKNHTLVDEAGNVIATISKGEKRINFNNNTWWER